MAIHQARGASLPLPGTGHYVVGPKGKVKVGSEFLRPGDIIPDAFSWPASALHSGLLLQRLQFMPKQPFDIMLPRKLASCLSRSLLARALAEYGAVVSDPEAHTKDALVDLLMQESGFEPKPKVEAAPEVLEEAAPAVEPEPSNPEPKADALEEAKRAKEKAKAGREAKRAAQLEAEKPATPPTPAPELEPVTELAMTPPPEPVTKSLREELLSFGADRLIHEVGPMYGLELVPGTELDALVDAIIAAAAPKEGESPASPTPAEGGEVGSPESLGDAASQELVSPAVVDD